MSSLFNLKETAEGLGTLWNARGDIAESFGGVANQMVTDTVESASNVVESAKVSIMSKFLPGLKRVVDKIAPTAIAASATLQHTGGQGSFVEYLQPAYLYSNFIILEDDRHDYIGWPCHQILTLSTVSGFTLCENVQIEASGATVEELEIIKQFLESGVIIE